MRHPRHFSENEFGGTPRRHRRMSPGLRGCELQSADRGSDLSAAARLLDEIDRVAETLTGDRRHFWLRPHGTPGSAQPKGLCPDTYDSAWEERKAERKRERCQREGEP